MLRRFAVHLGNVFGAEATPGNAFVPTFSAYPTDWLEPVAQSVVACAEIGELRCLAHKHAEDFDSEVSIGQCIRLYDSGTYSYASVSGVQVLVFDGVVVKKHIVISGREEVCEVVCYDLGGDLLRRIKLHGQMRLNHSNEQMAYTSGYFAGAIGRTFGTDTITIDTPLVFNPEGEPNATEQSYYDSSAGAGGNGNTFPLFEAPFRNQINASNANIKAIYWTLTDAIKYLLNVYPTRWAIAPSSYDDSTGLSLFATYGNPIVSNVNCEGDSLLQALDKLCAVHNYGFWLETKHLTTDTKLHYIHFFFKGHGETKTLDLSSRGRQANASTANLVQCDLTFDSTPVVNNIAAYGDRIRFTTLAHTNGGGTDLPLIKGWKDTDLTWQYETDGTTVACDHTDFVRRYVSPPSLIDPDTLAYGVGRLWVVNLGENPNHNLANLSSCLPAASGEHTSVDLRSFEKPELYTQNSAGGQLHQEEIVVEISLDSGDKWNVVEKNEYKIVHLGMGLVFVNPFLRDLGWTYEQTNTVLKTYWQALKDDTLRIRVLCGIKSDERVHCERTNSGATTPLANAGVFNNNGYKQIKYNANINDTIYYVDYNPLEVTQNDTSAMATVVQTQAACTDRLMISGRAQVLLQDFGEFKPGQSITAISNRTISFPFPPTVLKVIYKFPDQQVELILDNQKVPSLLSTKAISPAQTEREHTLGIGGEISPMQGTHKVPYLPGDIHSMENYYKRGGQ